MWTSTQPGVTRAPSASIVSRASPVTEPISTIRPSWIAMSAVYDAGSGAVDDGSVGDDEIEHLPACYEECGDLRTESDEPPLPASADHLDPSGLGGT